jgi:hypothetical protein
MFPQVVLANPTAHDAIMIWGLVVIVFLCLVLFFGTKKN